MQPVLFLGYDGCLHAAGVRHLEGVPQHHVEGHTLFEWSDSLVNLLEPYPNVAIVLNTAWVRIYGFDKARQFLPEPLRKRVIGTTHKFFRDNVEWASITEFDQIMRFVDAYGIKRWVALSSDKYYWPEAFVKNRVWLTKESGIGEQQVQEQVAERLDFMHQGYAKDGVLLLPGAGERDEMDKCWDAAKIKLADARLPELSMGTRFQATYDALWYLVRIIVAIDQKFFGLTSVAILEKLSNELLVDSRFKALAIALFSTWDPEGYGEMRDLSSSDVDAALEFTKGIQGLTYSRLESKPEA